MIDGVPTAPAVHERVGDALAAAGLSVRGGVRFDEAGPVVNGRTLKCLVLVGHIGSSHWPHFHQFRLTYEGPDPLDAWSKHVVEPVATAFSGVALYPFEKPWWPFQQWISRSEGLKPSPLGILIHPKFGLWHGYRAALGFDVPIRMPAPASLPHPCDSCVGRPCIAACPAGALATGRFEIGPCRDYLAGETDTGGCMALGCASRNACPVGKDFRYNDAQLRFHMAALTLPGRR